MKVFFVLVSLSIFTYASADESCFKIDMPLPEKTFDEFKTLVNNIPKGQAKEDACLSASKILKSKDSPEKQLAELMKDLSDEEIYTRLILAETLASTCPTPETAEAIAWVIKNRVDAKNSKRFGLGRGVVFKDYQFRSSTGDCDVAMRDAFMCPSSVSKGKWEMAQKAYKLTQNPNSKNPVGAKSYQYFFYKHFKQSKNCKKWDGVVPAWATGKAEVKTSALKLDRSCVRVFP